MNDTTQKALVLGATGSIGGEVARKLVERGWQVRALQRDPASLTQKNQDLEWVRGDAMVRDQVMQAAAGVSLIVHAVNPPGYHAWPKLVLPMIDNSIAAARANGARILLPGTIYNFGPETFPVIEEDAPQRPRTRKGAIRVEMERRLKSAAESGVPCLIVRAGDFFGPGHSNSWFSGAMIKRGRPLRSLLYPGQPGVGHQWAYVPDVAETMVQLLEKGDRLPAFACYHMQGHWDEDGLQMLNAVRRVAGKPIRVRRFPWWSLPLLGPFSEMLRELKEMRYLWQQPVVLDNQRLTAMLGSEPHTDWDEAVSTSLNALCVL